MTPVAQRPAGRECSGEMRRRNARSDQTVAGQQRGEQWPPKRCPIVMEGSYEKRPMLRRQQHLEDRRGDLAKKKE